TARRAPRDPARCTRRTRSRPCPSGSPRRAPPSCAAWLAPPSDRQLPQEAQAHADRGLPGVAGLDLEQLLAQLADERLVAPPELAQALEQIPAQQPFLWKALLELARDARETRDHARGLRLGPERERLAVERDQERLARAALLAGRNAQLREVGLGPVAGIGGAGPAGRDCLAHREVVAAPFRSKQDRVAPRDATVRQRDEHKAAAPSGERPLHAPPDPHAG